MTFGDVLASIRRERCGCTYAGKGWEKGVTTGWRETETGDSCARQFRMEGCLAERHVRDDF